MEYKFYLYIFSVLLITTPVLGEVTLGKGVVINQPDNNLTINVTKEFNTSSLNTYSNTTQFGDSNFSIDNPAGKVVDVFLDVYDSNAGDQSNTANFSATATDGDQITFKFTNLYNNSLYDLSQNGSIIQSTSTTSSGFYNFSNPEWSAKQNFTLQNQNNSRPQINNTEFIYNKETGIIRLNFGIDHNSENDIASYSGTGNQVEFTNSSLKLDVTLPVDSIYTVTDNKAAESPRKDLDISETDSGLQSDDFDNNLTKQQINRSITLSAATDGFDYNLTFADNGNALSATSFTGTISAGGSAENTAEWSGDWINHTLHSFSITGSEVTLSQNYTGTRNLELVEGKSVQWTGLNTSGYTNPPTTCSQSNASAVALSASTTTNKTVKFSCDPGDTGSPTFTPISKSGYEKYWYNTTLTVDSNLTENKSLVWPIDESNLKNWQDRDAGSANGIVNGKSSDITVVDGVGTSYLKVEDDFGNSSLHEGSHNASLTWTYGQDSDSSTSDGGSTGSTSDSSSDDTSSTNSDTTIRFSETTIRGVPGQVTPASFVVKNYLAENNTVTIAKKAGYPGCDLLEVETQTDYITRNDRVRITHSNEFDDGGTYTIPSRSFGFTEGSFGVRVNVRVRAPTDQELQNRFKDVDELVCPFVTNADKGQAGMLELKVESKTTFKDVLNNFYRALPFTGDNSRLLYSRDLCFSTQAQSPELCPEEKLVEDVPVPAQNASAVIVLVLLGLVVIGSGRFSSNFVKKYVLGKRQ